jgi:hypothetical protein
MIKKMITVLNKKDYDINGIETNGLFSSNSRSSEGDMYLWRLYLSI